MTPALILAEKRYISDILIVSLRDEASLRGEIIAYLKSGESLEILEENDEGFILVKTAAGKQGWIQKKYTIDEKPKDLIIAELEKKNEIFKAKLESFASNTDSLKTSSQTLKKQLIDKDEEIAKLEGTISSLKDAVKNAQWKYEDLKQKSQGVEEIFSERDNLLNQLKTADQEVALLRVANAELIQTDRLLWFLAGFGVFIVGWIMGKVFKRTRKRSLSL
ncbi:MAG: TIGR04211 family SH3 domain-containing protein [Proteobacteria bacterium]|nr:TIGR04211 family SH3 domain-containing protein [Pseudomonadota bacterium]